MNTGSHSIRNAFVGLSCLALLAASSLFASPAFASYDPPVRVARLSFVQGDVSFQPGGEDDWVWAGINRPLTTGDALWSDYGSRAELQLGSLVIRMDEQGDFGFLNVDDDTVQIQLNAGVLSIRLNHLYRNEVVEIDTPNVAITLHQAGQYRIEADPYGEYTSVAVRQGRARIEGGRRSYYVDAGTEVQAEGTRRVDYSFYDLMPPDEFDRWASDRDRRMDHSQSSRYVSREIIGYEDLDDGGTWRVDGRFGPVWIPDRVGRRWSPFHDGYWLWVEPWGWTWVDDEPWGFATSHYGRWAHLSSGRWCWIPPRQRRPGPPDRDWYAASYQDRPFYSPANVQFLGASRDFDGGAVAWFPLGPGEVFVPSYQASPTYINQVNITNTNVQITYINTVINNRTKIVHVNRQVPNAVVAVPRDVFVSARAVAPAARTEAQVGTTAPVLKAAPIAPERESVLGRGARGGGRGEAKSAEAAPRPPEVLKDRKVVAVKTPPPAKVPFERRRRAMAADSGKPLDPQKEQQLGTAAPAPPVVKAETAAPVTVGQAEKQNGPPADKQGGPQGDKQRPNAERKSRRKMFERPSNQSPAPVATPPPAQSSAPPAAERPGAPASREQQEAERARAAEAARQDEAKRRAQEEQAQRDQAEKDRLAEQARRDQAERDRREQQQARDPHAPRTPQDRGEEAGAPREPGPGNNRPGQREAFPAAAPGVERLRVAEDVQTPKLVSQPPLAAPGGNNAHGDVRVRALIGADGKVSQAVVISGGNKKMQAAALENVKGRVYQPTLSNGKPAEVETEVTIRF